eukprot:TRINITY_DN33754_c0_g1_i1.p1 TRINITY_DN33754_c0_g1~~TRINITY_DN33754_c0_g1_i1.p1  ORF type:complete len:456 (-),score=101.22 TRINITY_DN33754_c0_g1_i1:21-1334(-)
MSLKRRFMSKSDNEEKDDIIATPSHSPPPLVARCPTPVTSVGERQKRSISSIAEHIAKRVKTNQDDEIGTCGWCFQAKPPEFCLPGDTNSSSKLFCSDQCFSHYRRAIFKQTSECHACKKAILTSASLEIHIGQTKLHFCDIMCRQTFESMSLQQSSISPIQEEPADPLIFAPAHLLLAQAQAYLQSQLRGPLTNKDMGDQEVQKENDKPKLTIKPDHMLKTPVTMSRANVLRRMAIQDKHEPDQTKTRQGTGHADMKKQEHIAKNHRLDNQNSHRMQRFPRNQTQHVQSHNGEDITNMHHPPPLLLPPIPPMPLLPPPTLILPFPIFLPIPIPIPIPVPITMYEKAKVTDKIPTKAEVCQENESDYDDIGPREKPLFVNIKKEEDSEGSVPQICPQSQPAKARTPEPKMNPITTCTEGSNSDDESRRKRRAFIMDQ